MLWRVLTFILADTWPGWVQLANSVQPPVDGDSKVVSVFLAFAVPFRSALHVHCPLTHRGFASVSVAQSCPTLVTPWTVAHRAPLCMGCSGQECRSGLPFLLQGILPAQGVSLGLPDQTVRRYMVNYFRYEGHYENISNRSENNVYIL